MALMGKTGRGAAAPVLYSPGCVEGAFSELRAWDASRWHDASESYGQEVPSGGGGEQGGHTQALRRGGQRPEPRRPRRAGGRGRRQPLRHDEHKRGIEGFRHVSEWGIALLPDGRYEVLDMIAEGDMVICR